jgi:acyl-CoA thioesterase
LQVPDIPLNYEKSGLMGIAKWAFATICLSLDIRRDPKGQEWLLQRTVMNECKDGRFDMEVKLYTEGGELVASSAHSCLMFARASQGKVKEVKRAAVL